MNWEAIFLYAFPVSAIFILIIIHPLIFDNDKGDEKDERNK